MRWATRSTRRCPRFQPGDLGRIVGQQPHLVDAPSARSIAAAGHSRARRRQSRAAGWPRPCPARDPAAHRRELVGKADAAAFLAQVEQDAAALLADQPKRGRSCGPQSHLRLPNTSPVRHSLCSRTSGGLPPGAPTSSATCSLPSSRPRKATICVSGSPRAAARPGDDGDPGGDWRRPSPPHRRRTARRPVEQPQRRQQPGQRASAKAARGCASVIGSGRLGCSGPARSEARSRARDRPARAHRGGSSQGARSAPARARDRAHRWLASPSAAARAPLSSSGRVPADRAIRSSSSVAVSTAGRSACRPPTGAPARSAAIGLARPSLKPRARPSAARGRTAAPRRGTARARGAWSPAPRALGEAHMWSSRRPRSFLVQSGER
jgi:hypothetical protein